MFAVTESALLLTKVSVRIEPYHHNVTMVQILGNLYQALVLAIAVIRIVFVLIHLNNHNVIAHIEEKVGPSLGASCNSNTTKWIRFSWTPSTVNRTQGPHWYPAAVILNE